ncbi:MAG: ATP-dependent helicase, partial [Bradyrhizobium sp.]|nr:ATP-dependent helicase [Bradyrhizobium sp.]
RSGRIPDAWFAAQIDQADRSDGDIDTLSHRIAQIRTWTFVANRPDWLADPEHWQGISREVENKLSDALHERLTERFVDRRTSVLMRRLRENTMLNTEIGKTGEVIVEGHVIGRLDGFTFAPDAAEAGSDAKALQATALKALAGEIEARAEKLSAAKDDQLVLTSDGTIRWTGDAVAKLVAADDVLHPRIRIISDDRLSGAPREAVQARLDLWLKTHIEKLLGPLFDLAKAEDVTGIARGIAFQLIEALGVLERAKIAAEMKDLDQPSRASLRKYGVRFGAYHIYVPALLKPAARALASLLWAEKQDNIDMSALSGAQHLAGSGRTSFPVDKSLDRDAYRVLGYRQCGERAVRVDILERLADLIRPALSWRAGSPGEKPACAFDGRSFVVTQAMTSLTGSAGEDFASILRALGYRMEKRLPLPPAPAPVAVEAAAAEATGAEAVSAEAAPETTPSETAVQSSAATADAGADITEPIAAAETGDSADITNDVPQAVEETATPSTALPPEATLAPATSESEPASVEAQPDPAALGDVEAAATETPQQTEAPQEAAAVDATAATAAEEAPADASAAVDAAPAVAAAPEMVEVWRPGGRSEERRPRHDRARHRPQVRPQEGAQPVAAEGEVGEGAKRERHGRGRRERNKEFGKPRSDAPAEAASPVVAADAAPAVPREDKGRPPRERFQGKGRDGRDKGKFAGKPKGDRDSGRPGGGPSHRQYASSAPPRERERPIDPNSPFAKLAALKEQLTAGRKDQR